MDGVGSSNVESKGANVWLEEQFIPIPKFIERSQ